MGLWPLRCSHRIAMIGEEVAGMETARPHIEANHRAHRPDEAMGVEGGEIGALMEQAASGQDGQEA